MPEPTLVEVFGANATQDATQLIISKADLATVGLTPAVANTAESIITALLLLAKVTLNETTQSTNPDIQVVIELSDRQTLVTRNALNYREATFAITLQTSEPAFTIDPDNY